MTFRIIILVFNRNETLNPIVIQFVVGVTTLLMVIRFVLDALRHRSRSEAMKMTLILMDAVTQAMIMYSLGIMQRPSGTNSYYQVWAVLLVTLRYGVKIGRPAGIWLKQTPLVDLMSSFWAANILRSQAMKILKVTGWLLWSVNSLRIIHCFLSSEFANNSHRESMRLLADYMRHEHRVGGHGDQRPDPSTMRGYRYLVLGESKKQMMKEEAVTGRQASRDVDGMIEETENIRRLVLALRDEDKKIVTLEKIWSEQAGAGSSDVVLDEELKDLCLSFALYKLLRRRFFNFSIHEANLEKTRRLVLEGILGVESSNSDPDDKQLAKSGILGGESSNSDPHDEQLAKSGILGDESSNSDPHDEQLAKSGILGGESSNSDRHAKYRRAFRISEAEIAFLNDFFNSRHAIIFANGFPIIRLVLSTVLLGGIAGMAVAIHRFSKVAKVDELGGVHHGVVFTWILLSFLGVKEIWEIITYVFSDWTKILMLCKYVEKPWWFRGPVAKFLVGKLCRWSVWPRWHGKIGQCNLLFPTSFLCRGRRSMYLVDLTDEVKRSVINCLSYCLGEKGRLLDNFYVERALSSLGENATGEFCNIVKSAGAGVEGDVQTLLVWHIATCYSEMAYGEKRGVTATRLSYAQSFSQGTVWSSYMIARTLSQYCAYVLGLVPPLVPGNSLMASSVRNQVYGEKMDLFLRDRQRERCDLSTGILEMLKDYALGKTTLYNGEQDKTILKKGADLGKKLVQATGGGDAEHLWEFLSEFWAGFIIHLAASTRAYQHKIFLTSGGELMTHIWALLSHAGVLGAVEHGDQEIETAQMPGEVYDPNAQY